MLPQLPLPSGFHETNSPFSIKLISLRKTSKSPILPTQTAKAPYLQKAKWQWFQ